MLSPFDDIQGPFEGQGDFLINLPTLIQLMRTNLTQLELESLSWYGGEEETRVLLGLEWLKHSYFIEYKAKYQEAYILLVNLNNKISGIYEVAQNDINYAMQVLMHAISIGVPPGGFLYGEEEGHSNEFVNILLPNNIVRLIVDKRRRLWARRGWISSLSLSSDSSRTSSDASGKAKRRKSRKRTRKRRKKRTKKR
jgi:hypothetical protein